ncbi:hypothetical protein ACQXZ2_10790 [Corynebacterium diphtheriae]
MYHTVNEILDRIDQLEVMAFNASMDGDHTMEARIRREIRDLEHQIDAMEVTR